MRQKINSLAASAIGVLIALLLGEAGLQLLDYPKPKVSGWHKCNNQSECNYLGFRGREIIYGPEDYVIVLLGDSEASSIAYPFEKMPERILETLLKDAKKNVRVFTLANSGYGQDQQLMVLKEYFKKHRADLVLLMFTARNDIQNNMFATGGANNTIKPSFWIENGKLVGPTEEWLAPVGSWLKLALLWQTYVAAPRHEMWEELLPPPYQPLNDYEGEVDYSWQNEWDSGDTLGLIDIDIEKIGAAPQLTPRSERYQYGIELTRQLFYEIKKTAEAHGGHFIIIKEERPWEMQDLKKERVYFLNGNYYKTSIEQYKDNLEELFMGLEHYRIPLPMENYTISPGNTHLNDNALNYLLKELAEIISEKDYFKNK